MPSQRSQDPYDTVFDFVFSTQKKAQKGGKKDDKGVNMPAVSGLGEAFAEIAVNPALYPVNSLVSNMEAAMNGMGNHFDWHAWGRKEGYVEEYQTRPDEDKDGKKLGVGEVGDLRFRIKTTETSKFLSNPRGFINKAWAGYKAEKKWARFGAFTKAMSAAQFGIWTNQALKGVIDDKKQRSQLAGMVSSAMKGGDNLLSRSLFSESKLLRGNYKRAAQEVASSHGVERDVIDNAVGAAARDTKAKTKTQQFDRTVSNLRSSGVDEDEAKNIAGRFWGSRGDDDDLGIMGENQQKLAKQEVISKLQNQIRRLSGTGDPADAKKAEKIKGLIRGMNTLNGGWGTMAGVAGAPFMLGQFVGKLGFSIKWFQDNMAGGKGFGMAMGGGMFSVEDYGVVRKSGVDVLSRDSGDKVDSMNAMVRNKALPQGRFHSLYYLHPGNIIPGLLDGRYMQLLARKVAKGDVYQDNFFYKMYKVAPLNALKTSGIYGAFKSKFKDKIYGATIGNLKSVLIKFGSKFIKDGTDLATLGLRELLQKIISTGITQLLGSVVPGIGNAAALVADVVISFSMDLVMKPLLQLVGLIIIGAIGLIFITVGFGKTIFGGSSLYHIRHQNPPMIDSGMALPPAGPRNWRDDSKPPGTYTGSCPAPGSSQVCTQGSGGNVSDYHNRTRAVDFSLVGGTPIVAPNDGEVIRSQSATYCGDGTNYGGTIAFRESESGYIWTFKHVHPNVSVGDTLSQGDVIGFIDGHSTAEYSPSCWTGPHLHVHVQDENGAYFDSEVFLNQIGCNFSC